MSGPIRVLVVDDSAFMRKALSREIGADARFVVAGTACDGREGVRKALELDPDVITLDVEMPVQDGLTSLQQLAAQSPAGVIMVSASTEAGARITLEALALGAIDVIPKAQGTTLLYEKLLAAASVRQRRRGGGPERHIKTLPADGFAGVLPRDFFPKILVIGSSTGGPQALAALFNNLTPPLAVPVLVAQHMPSPFTAALARRLSGQSGHDVAEAKDGEAIANGTVYIAPGGFQMRIREGAISISRDCGESIYQPSVGILAASALEAYGKNILGVMLTGLGRDGAREFTKLKEAGGWTIAQDGASCTVFGMPQALIKAGGACEVAALKAIPHRITEILASKAL